MWMFRCGGEGVRGRGRGQGKVTIFSVRAISGIFDTRLYILVVGVDVRRN
jgi:hypothetical protein